MLINYYYSTDGITVNGPNSIEELVNHFEIGGLPSSTLICAEGSEEWESFSNILKEKIVLSDQASIKRYKTNDVASEKQLEYLKSRFIDTKLVLTKKDAHFIMQDLRRGTPMSYEELLKIRAKQKNNFSDEQVRCAAVGWKERYLNIFKKTSLSNIKFVVVRLNDKDPGWDLIPDIYPPDLILKLEKEALEKILFELSNID